MLTRDCHPKKVFLLRLSVAGLALVSEGMVKAAAATQLPHSEPLPIHANPTEQLITQDDRPPLAPQDIEPPDPLEPLPEIPPEPPPNPEDLLPTSPSETLPTLPPELRDEQITVTTIRFEGNTLFSAEELRQALLNALPTSNEALDDIADTNQTVLTHWTEQTFTIAELLQFAGIIAGVYQSAGYDTSGAVVRIPEITQLTRRGEVVIEVIEGSLESIELSTTEDSSNRLNPGYVRSRLGVEIGEPLNVDALQESLQLLQLDPLINGITAELNAGPEIGSSLLTVLYQEADTFDVFLNLNNSRSPSIGSFERGVTVSQGNLVGFGDGFSLNLANSDGSNTISANYRIPLNSANGTLNFNFSTAWYDVIEPPFDDIDNDGSGPDIQSTSTTYEITYRQPLIRTIKNRIFQEFAIGLTGSFRDSQSYLLGEPFPLSPGADDNGRTKVFALRFFQDWTLQDRSQVISFRSQFNLGLEALGSTINDPVPGVESIPDSEFFSWQGQAQWARLLGPDTLFILRGNAQFADQTLLLSEQFSIGGFGSVRGYRQNQLLTDNGVFGSAEVRFPIMRVPEWLATLRLAPFVDMGTGWDSSGQDIPGPDFLASAGLGLQWEQGNNFTARFDFGIPLVSVESTGNSWQENGVLFSIVYNPF